MSRDLTTSAIARQNILNNPYAIAEIETAVGIRGVPFEGTHVVLKEQVAAFFEVTTRTVEAQCAANLDELTTSGYAVLKGKRLKALKESIPTDFDPEANFGITSKTNQLAVFSFRAFLNLAMLLPDNDRARLLRQAILDIAIDTVSSRTGGSTKYINQRDEEFIHASFSGEKYRKEFTNALKDHLDMGNFKYAVYTDRIYQAVFLEKSKDYRAILKLDTSDATRDTFYAEVINLISSFELGLANEIKAAATAKGTKLRGQELDAIIAKFASQPHWTPLYNNARRIMASRDLAFRDALHDRLTGYIAPVQRDEFERFIGTKSKELTKRLEEAQDVLKRLKDR